MGAVAAVFLAAVNASAPVADAAQISGAITNVTVVAPPHAGDPFAITEDWCVPDGTQAGDTFSQTLPAQMGGFPSGFTLADPAGDVVATASVSNTSPAVVTFTMTAFAETHQHVCGTAQFAGQISSAVYGNTTQTLTFVNNDGTTDTATVPVLPNTGTIRTQAQKTGGFVNSNDQCRTNQTNCLFWELQSPLGPFDSGAMSDTATSGQTFDCPTATLLIGNDSGSGNSFVQTGKLTSGATIACSSTAISATYGAVPAGEMVELYVGANISSGPNNGGVTYHDSSTIKTVVSGTTQTDTPSATTTSAFAGGNGNGTQTPKISIVKWDTADGPTNGAFDSAPGKVLTVNTPTPITMTITNTGTEPLVNVAVTDATTSGPALTGLTCDFSALGGPNTPGTTTWKGPFAVGASFPCTGTVPAMDYETQETDTATVTANGQTDNTAVTDNNPWNGATPTPVPSVTISKFDTADGPVNGAFDTAPGKAVAAGTPVPITMTITNNGQEPLTNVTVTDATTSGPALTGLTCDFSALGGPNSPGTTTWKGPLAVGASFNCTGTVPAMPVGTQETDTATVNGTGAISGTPVTANNPWNGVTPTPAPAITIVKGDVNGNAANTAATAPNLGDEPASVGLVYTITNNGNEPLKNITVTDQLITNGTVTGLTCDFSKLGGPDAPGTTTWQGPLAPGASFPCTAQLSGVLAGTDHQDIGNVAGTGVVSGTNVSSTNPYFASATTLVPAVTINKYSTADGPVNGAFDTAPGKSVAANTPVPITMLITNTGNDALTDVTVSDATSSGPALTGLSCAFPAGGGASTATTWKGPFAVGASFTCTGTVPAMPVGIQETDTATVNGTGAISGTPVTANNPWNGVTPTPAPAITIVKGDSNGNAADTASAAAKLTDGTASLVYTITNNGNEPLKNITVTDTVVTNGTVTGLTCNFTKVGGPATGTTWAGPIAPAASFTCTAALTGVAAGATDHQDIGTVTGTGVISGTIVSDTNPYYASETPAPAIITAGTAGGPPSSGGPGLAYTGSDTELYAALGGLLLVLGSVLLLASSRRNRKRG